MNVTSGQERVSDRPNGSTASATLWPPAYLSGTLWLAPLAVVAGALASGAALSRPDTVPSLAMAVLLSLSWGIVWRVVAGVNWSAPLAEWQGWMDGAPLKALPYAQPDSDAAYLSRRIGQLARWLSQALLPYYGHLLLFGLMSLALMIVLAAALGSWATLLAIGALCLAQIAAVACRGDGHPNAALEGATVVGLPMLLGAAIIAPMSPDVLLIGVALTVAFAGVRSGSQPMRNVGYGLAVLAAVAMRQPMSAFALAVIWAPQLILSARRGGYGWLAMAMLAFAVTRATGG